MRVCDFFPSNHNLVSDKKFITLEMPSNHDKKNGANKITVLAILFCYIHNCNRLFLAVIIEVITVFGSFLR